MKDLGFGVLDRRTVIVSLLVIAITNIVFHYSLPIRTNNVGELFLDLVLLTGYIYLARSLFRLPFAVIYGLITGFEIFQSFLYRHGDIISKRKLILTKIILYLIIRVYDAIQSIYIGIYLFTSALEEEQGDLISSLFNFVDRIGFIVIIILSTLPNYTSIVKVIGIIGILLMLLIFIAKGDFTLFLQDNIQTHKKDS